MNLGDEGSSPWDDVPSTSRSNSSQNIPQISRDAANKPEDAPAPASQAQSSAGTVTKTPGGRGSRIKRYGAQSTTLEAAEDPLGPLGASAETLGGSTLQDEPPAPPRKEQTSARAVRTPTSASHPSLRSMMDSVDLNDDEEAVQHQGPRVPPPVQPANNEPARRQNQPSMSVEQAAKPTFTIYVGDPHKVGDLTSSHTEYQVRTKTTSKAYRQAEFSVSRRYRDFLWLYEQLHTNNPGIIVPPPPEKQITGRFDTDFVESRRQALERMLNKTAAHPMLQHDSDLKLFLESDAFNVDVKNRERKDPGFGESKGMFSSIGIGSGNTGKFIEHDDWFQDRQVYLDALETQLKALLKATDTVVAQRKGLASASGDLSASLHSLAAVELSPTLSGPLDSLSDIQIRIRELYERQAQQDVLTLGIVIDEYIRLIGSVKQAFLQRQKSFHTWHNAESELQKRKTAQDKILRQGRSQQDRLNQLSADVSDAERKVHQARLVFEDQGRLMRQELEKFEREKVEDFKSGVETYLESAVEAQKELIEIWETYLMQLDAEEDGVPFGNSAQPAGVVAKATGDSDKGADENERPVTAQSEISDGTLQTSAATAAAAAAEEHNND